MIQHTKMFRVTMYFSIFVVFSAAADHPCDNVKMTNYVADPDDCSMFYICHLGRHWKFSCGKNAVWDAVSKTCVPIGSRFDKCTIKADHPSTNPRKCQPGSSDVIPHPDQCALYLNCSANPQNDFWGPNVRECPYPKLFNAETRRCEYYEFVNCGSRAIPIEPCDYKVNQCRTSHCIPCHVRFPSCKDLSDGLNPWVGKSWSPYFVVCKNQRVVFQGTCPNIEDIQRIFDPKQLLCVDPRGIVIMP